MGLVIYNVCFILTLIGLFMSLAKIVSIIAGNEISETIWNKQYFFVFTLLFQANHWSVHFQLIDWGL